MAKRRSSGNRPWQQNRDGRERQGGGVTGGAAADQRTKARGMLPSPPQVPIQVSSAVEILFEVPKLGPSARPAGSL